MIKKLFNSVEELSEIIRKKDRRILELKKQLSNCKKLRFCFLLCPISILIYTSYAGKPIPWLILFLVSAVSIAIVVLLGKIMDNVVQNASELDADEKNIGNETRILLKVLNDIVAEQEFPSDIRKVADSKAKGITSDSGEYTKFLERLKNWNDSKQKRE